MLHKQLQDAGLNETEAKIYLAALELGETSISRIAKKSAIKRTTVYLSLENLVQKGLISAIKKKNRTYYYAEDPRNLARIMEEKKERVLKLVPQLLTFTNLIDKKPQVRYFEGLDGVKEVLEETLNYPNQEIRMFYSETSINDFEDKYFSNYYVPKRLARRISVRAILPDNAQIREYAMTNQTSLRRTKFFPSDTYKVTISILLYGNGKVCIISYLEMFALIIESPQIYESLKGIFETMWAVGAE
jgi:HTH-type transcriptional regulator, sugar sensing transcriptional regulator